MEEYFGSVQSANINEKWLENIFENIKKLEDYERLIRDGCKSVLDFLNISPKLRQVVIGDTQFKTISLFVTEFKLLLADLTPVIENEAQEFNKVLDSVDKAIKQRNLFVRDVRNTSNNIIEVIPTPFFWETINILHKTKVDLFKRIKNILYINSNR